MRARTRLAAGVLAATVSLLMSSCGTSVPIKPASVLPFRVEPVAALPSSYRAYLVAHMYYVSASPPYHVIKSMLMGADPSILATVPCAARPTITAAVPGHLILACNGGPIKQLILLSVDNGHTAVLFQRTMTVPVMAFAIWTGTYLVWRAESGVGQGPYVPPLPWGVTDGQGKPVAASVLQQLLAPVTTYNSLNDLNGHLFIFAGPVLKEWTGSRFASVGVVPVRNVRAAGGGEVVSQTSSYLQPPWEPTTYTLQSVNPPRNVVSWRAGANSALVVVGMTFTISYYSDPTSPQPIILYFPLRHRRYVITSAVPGAVIPLTNGGHFSSMEVANGQLYFKTKTGYARVVVTGAGMETMMQPPGGGTFWP